MSKIKVCVIGAGNITNTRHIPALQKTGEFEIVGVVSDEQKKLDRTRTQHPFTNELLIDSDSGKVFEQLQACDWFVNEVEAVVIGTQPYKHFEITKACLLLDKHVLVEKPMMMDVQQCKEVSDIANKNGKILYVMHNFQYADSFMKMERKLKDGEYGDLTSILELQLTNRARRLPKWYNELPLGLFFDEAAHFFYTAYRLGGDIKILNAHAQYGKAKEETPMHLSIQSRAGEIPVQMFINFNSPVCEWMAILFCEKKIVIYDYFKDIIVEASNDGMHGAKDVLRVCLQYTWTFWKGFVTNGFRMVTHNLLYGQYTVMGKYAKAIKNNEIDPALSAECGMRVVDAMNQVVLQVKKENV